MPSSDCLQQDLDDEQSMLARSHKEAYRNPTGEFSLLRIA